MIGLTLIALLVSGQVGVCKPGVQCKVRSVTATAPSGSNGVVVQSGACLQSGEVFWRRSAANIWSVSTTCSGGNSLTINSSSGALSAGGIVQSSSAAGANAFAILNAGARADFGPGLNDWASSDGGVVHIEPATSFGSTENLNILANGTINTTAPVNVNNTSLAPNGTGYIQNGTAGLPVLINDTEGLRLQGVATASLMLFDGGTTQGGILQFDTTTGKMKVTEGTGGSFSWKTIYTGTGADTREGALCGYWPLATVADGNPKAFTAHLSRNGGLSVGLQWVSTLVGAGAGGFVIRAMLPDAGELCATPAIACNTAVGTPVSTVCGGAAFLTSDLVTLTYAGACTGGQNPTGNATFSFSE